MDQCRAAGIRLIMLTGDHSVTAHAIAADLVGRLSRSEIVAMTGDRRPLAGLSLKLVQHRCHRRPELPNLADDVSRAESPFAGPSKSGKRTLPVGPSSVP